MPAVFLFLSSLRTPLLLSLSLTLSSLCRLLFFYIIDVGIQLRCTLIYILTSLRSPPQLPFHYIFLSLSLFRLLRKCCLPLKCILKKTHISAFTYILTIILLILTWRKESITWLYDKHPEEHTQHNFNAAGVKRFYFVAACCWRAAYSVKGLWINVA